MNMTSKIESAIRSEFPGNSNAGIRKEIRETILAGGNVVAIARRIGLTGHRGMPSLKAIADVVEAETQSTAN